MNMHSSFDELKRSAEQLPPSFTLLASILALQGWDQGHTELIVTREGMVQLIQKFLDDVEVDESWYLETYPDVSEAVAAGACLDALTHYRTFGYFEGRLPSLHGFNPLQYLDKNPDLKQPLGGKGPNALQDHFIQYGYREGRPF